MCVIGQQNAIWSNARHDCTSCLAFFALQHVNESQVQVISYRRDATAIEAQKQALFGSNWKLLSDKLELCVMKPAAWRLLGRLVLLLSLSKASSLSKKGQVYVIAALGLDLDAQ